MAAQLFASTPQPYLDELKRPKDKKRLFRVIGAGYSHTGTQSFTLALEKLLKGPMCNGRSVIVSREEDWMRSWISILDPKPPNTSEAYIIHTLQTLLRGYVGVADLPCIQFVGEMCEAFPDAVVICTTQDSDKWWASMEPLIKSVTPWWLPVLLLSTATLRYLSDWNNAMTKRDKIIYGPGFKAGRGLLGTHLEYVKRVTPPERLHFFNVKEGWAPLCKILNVPIPDEPFPHINDQEQVQKEHSKIIVRGIIGWLQILGVLGGIVFMMKVALK